MLYVDYRMRTYFSKLVFHLLTFCFGILLLHFYWGLNDFSCLFYIGTFITFLSLFEYLRIKQSLRLFRLAIPVFHSIISIFFPLIALVHADNVNKFGPLLEDTTRAIFQSNYNEIISYSIFFISDHVSAWFIIWASIILFSYIFLLYGRNSIFLAKHAFPFFLLAFIFGTNLIYLGRHDINLFIDEASAYKDVLNEYKPSRNDLRKHKWFNELSSDFTGNIIIAIGESTSRHHMGIYNYFRNTTPNLGLIQNKLHIFTDVISTHSHTTESLSDALTLNSRSDRQVLTQLPDIISLLNKGDFYTAWLSNQNAVGIWDNYVSAIAGESDFIKYHDPAGGERFKRSVYDHELINSLDDLLDQNNNHTKKAVFLHLMSTHFPYCTVIPKEFEDRKGVSFEQQIDLRFFGSSLNNVARNINAEKIITDHLDSVNCYDSAVRYVDFLLYKIIQRLEQESTPTLFIYLSDHGEAPTLNTGHESRMHSHFHVEIPFIVWTNTPFIKNYPSIIKAIDQNKHKPISLIDFSYSLADSARLSEIPDTPKRSFFSTSFEPFNRTTIFGQVGYDIYSKKSDYAEKTRANLIRLNEKLGADTKDRIWAHRINSIGSLLEAKDIFSGIELDVNYDSENNEFYIYHPPSPNVELSLERYLSLDNGKIKYWFDWKNPTHHNTKDALERLNELDLVFKFKQRTIIETGTTTNLTQMISNAHWLSSYYLPTDEILRALENNNQNALNTLAKKTLNIIEINKYNAVSFDIRLMPFYTQYLKEYAENNDLKIFSWAHWLSIADENSADTLIKHLSSNDLDILLVSFPSPFRL